MDSKLTAENKENVGKSGKSGKGTLDIIQQAREEYGRYIMAIHFCLFLMKYLMKVAKK